jgi:hypothetical protein
MSSIEVLIKFKKLLLSFNDELIERFPAEADFVVMRIFIDTQIPTKTIMDNFTTQLNKDDMKIRNIIINRDDAFFIKERPFSFMSAERTNKLGTLWLSGTLDDDDKGVLWSWVDSFVILSDRYAKL